MPYRRLPNTDAARIRAMKRALEIGRELSPLKLAFSAKNLVRLQKFLPNFEQSIQYQKQTIATQVRKSKNYSDTEKKARIYLTHFIRVMNMAIYRGELTAETRAFYGIATNDSTVPSFNTENELVSWGKRIIEGEELRIRKGGSPITNPTIAVVKVRFGQFIDVLNNNNSLFKRNQEYMQKLHELRREADELILGIWNEVEAFFMHLDDNDRREKCEEYGLVYFFRKSELEKNDTNASPEFLTLENVSLLPGIFSAPPELMPKVVQDNAG
jgi:hypothetical protein